MRHLILLVLACSLSTAQTQDPAHDPLEKGYQSLRAGNYQEAVSWFRTAAEGAPDRAAIWKELGYTYRKQGDEESSRRAFEKAVALNPKDHHTALELAFSFQRGGQTARAATLFQEVERNGDREARSTAQRALRYLREAAEGSPAAESGKLMTTLSGAYQALAAREYEQAAQYFQEAIRRAPQRADLRKELGYLYLKMGETEWGREMFEQAVRLDPADQRARLELAFLHHETGQPARALELFRQVQASGDPDTQHTAEATLSRIEAEMQQAISRWREAVQMDPLNRSAQLELADLYDRYGEPEKAVQHYLAAWAHPSEPRRDEILLRLAASRQAGGDPEGAAGAWLLASRSGEPCVSESAKEKLPDRHPYASEFRRALRLDPANTALRQDLAYLLLEVGRTEEARSEFEAICKQDPDDLVAAAQLAFLYLERSNAAEAVELLERARQSEDGELARRAQEALRFTREEQARPHRTMGDRSLQKSYLKDAKLQFLRAYEANPNDHDAALKLGIVHNLLQQDREAMRWFRIATASSDPVVAEQAQRSYANLAPQFRRFSTTLWTFPFFSTRYHDAFQYAQLKSEIRLGSLPVRPYLSLRFVGDLKQRTADASPQFLSESSLIAGLGLRTRPTHGVTFWAEAGEAFSYLRERPAGVPRAGPDYRGGVNWFRAPGATLAGPRAGLFSEVNLDLVYLSRFDDDWLAYWQLRPGYRLPSWRGFKSQLYWNFNATVDRNRAYWANYVEFGPGFRFRLPDASLPLDFTINFVRGVHLINDFNPRRPNYYDLRIGLWYAFAL